MQKVSPHTPTPLKISAEHSAFVNTNECRPEGTGVYVKTLQGETIMVCIDLGAKIEEFKQIVEAIVGTPADDQRLTFAGWWCGKYGCGFNSYPGF
jgi:hypothetical protein